MQAVKARSMGVMVLIALVLVSCTAGLSTHGKQDANPEKQAAAVQTLQYRLTQLVAETQPANFAVVTVMPVMVQVTPQPQEQSPHDKAVSAAIAPQAADPVREALDEQQAVPQPQLKIPVIQVVPVGANVATVPDMCYRAELVSHVTVPDGTEIPAGTDFVKTWQLKNTGTCTWESSTRLLFIGGEKMNTLEAQQISTTVLPGGAMSLSAEFTAPSQPGVYTGYWQLSSPDGQMFGTGEDGSSSFWVNIEVP